jgi:signal transduction histidine kinase
MGREPMISNRYRRLIEQIDVMLDAAISGDFHAQDFDESMKSKIESKMARFLDGARIRREQIEDEQRRVHSLVSDISHQTKTPIANITLYAGLLAEQDLNKEQQELARQISESADKLNFQIQALVKISRLESGIIRVEPRPGDIHELIATAVCGLRRIATDKGVDLVVKQSAFPVVARYDPRWCAEALSNIIDNAVKYTPKGGRAMVSVTEHEMFVRVDVADTGRGIREDELPKIFTRFWRAPESSDSPGVGIGLYLAREIIMAQDGYIKVQSDFGKGSVFSVFLSKV